MKLIRIIFILLLLITGKESSATQILAIVNNEAITITDLDARMNLLVRINHGNLQDNFSTRKQIMQNLVDEKLYIMEANNNNIKISNEEIKERVEIAHKSNPELPVDSDTIINQIKAQLLWSKLVNMKLRSSISVTNQEINEAAKTFSSEDYHLTFKEIIFRDRQYYKDTKKIEVAKNKVKNCDEFIKLASEFKADKPETFNVKWSELGEHIKPYLASLKVGEVSNPAMFGNTQTLFCICAKDQEELTQELKEKIKLHLSEKKMVIASKNYLEDIKKRTFIKYY